MLVIGGSSEEKRAQGYANDVFETYFKEAVHEIDLFITSKISADEHLKMNQSSFMEKFVNQYCNDTFSWGFHEGLTESEGKKLPEDQKQRIELSISEYTAQLEQLCKQITNNQYTADIFKSALLEMYCKGYDKALESEGTPNQSLYTNSEDPRKQYSQPREASQIKSPFEKPPEPNDNVVIMVQKHMELHMDDLETQLSVRPSVGCEV